MTHPENYRKAHGEEIACEQCRRVEKRVVGYQVRHYCLLTGKNVGQFYTCGRVS